MASLFEENDQPLNGYDIARLSDGPRRRRIEVRCTNGGALRAAALVENGQLIHVAVEPTEYGREALTALAIAMREEAGHAT